MSVLNKSWKTFVKSMVKDLYNLPKTEVFVYVTAVR